MKLSTHIVFPLVFTLLGACSPDATQPAASNDTVVAELAQEAEIGDWGVELSNRDLSVRPQDDFFRYANGNWLKTTEIPADKSRTGIFDSMRDRSDERVRAIIEELISSEPATGSMEQKISQYYLSYMDTDRLNQLGAQPLADELAAIAAIDNIASLTAAFGRSRLDTTDSPFSFGIGPERTNPDRNQLGVSVTGISMPDRDYYLLDEPRFQSLREEFKLHVATMLDFAGFAETVAMSEAVLEVEARIAGIMWPRDQRRNSDLTFNPMSYADFKSAYSGFDWDNYFAAAGIEGLNDLNVVFPSAMQPVIELVNSLPLSHWKSFLAYKLINNNSSILSEAIDGESFRFYGTEVNGIVEQRERWERAVARVGGLNSLGEALGQVYVERYFPESAKQQMNVLVENLRLSLEQSINENDWMDEPTRHEAILKLQAFRPKIAYPDVWKDLSAIAINRDDLVNNDRSVREYFYQDLLSRLGKPTDREEWRMTPQTVNAYYNTSFNEIVFPAGILQPPFFDPAADLAVNYGAIGAVIGHEMGHGFDDQGTKSDYQGVQRDWWTADVRAAFEQRADRLADQYASYEPMPGFFIDGRFTLGENIGDVGGLSIAYRAYKIALNGEEAPVIDGLTGDQRFYLGFAQVWQGKIRNDALVTQLKSDPHSPAEFRANGTVRNQGPWYEAFDVKEGDAMYLPPAERVRIW